LTKCPACREEFPDIRQKGGRAVKHVFLQLLRRSTIFSKKITWNLCDQHDNKLRRFVLTLAAVLLVGFVSTLTHAAGEGEIKARISFPCRNALIRANVPVFGKIFLRSFFKILLDNSAGRGNMCL